MSNVLVTEEAPSPEFSESEASVALVGPAPGEAALLRPIPDVAFWSALAVMPAAVGFGALALAAGSRRSRVGAAIGAGVGAAVGLGLLRWQLSRLFTEEPRYIVVQRLGKLEVRRYPTVIRATTTVRGHHWRAALDEGFGRLARYIFGGNAEQERLAMTAPVTTFRNDSEAGPNAEEALDVSFSMPEGRTLSTLPTPGDDRIHLVEDAPRLVAVLRYSGPFDIDLTRRKQRELFEAVEHAGLHPIGDPGFAGYDPPSTIPLLRRNEVWMDVEKPAPSTAPG